MNLQDAPVLPPNLTPNIYGISLARWHYKGFHYGPDRQPMPDHIAGMEDEKQAEVALKNYHAQEVKELEIMQEAAAAEAEKEAQAIAEAKKREEAEVEAEIERRANARAAEIIAEARKQPGPAQTKTEDLPVDTTDDDSAPKELGALLAACKTKDDLIATLKDVHWLNIRRAVEGFGEEPGKKKENVEILAKHLGLS